MNGDLRTILTSNNISPRQDLEADIVRVVYAKHARRIALRFWISVSVGVASIVGLIPAISNMSTKLTQSGFYEYMSLAFSNGGIVSKYSSDFAIAIGESIPILSITIFLIIGVVFLWSIRNIFKESMSPYFRLSIN